MPPTTPPMMPPTSSAGGGAGGASSGRTVFSTIGVLMTCTFFPVASLRKVVAVSASAIVAAKFVSTSSCVWPSGTVMIAVISTDAATMISWTFGFGTWASTANPVMILSRSTGS